MRHMSTLAFIGFVAVCIAYFLARGSFHDERQEACEQSQDICKLIRPNE
jgi:hypothetical protein